MAVDGREIFYEQCGGGVGGGGGAAGRSGGGGAGSGAVPGAARLREWGAELFCAAVEGQDCDAIGADRRSGVEGERRIFAGNGGRGDLHDSGGAEPFAGG